MRVLYIPWPVSNTDAGLILHDLPQRRRVVHVENAHMGKISGICFADNDRLLSCGVDRNIKLWNINPSEEDMAEGGTGPSTVRLHSARRDSL